MQATSQRGDEFLSARIGADGADLRFGQLVAVMLLAPFVACVATEVSSNTACWCRCCLPSKAAPHFVRSVSVVIGSPPPKARTSQPGRRQGRASSQAGTGTDSGFNSGCLARFLAHRGDGVREFAPRRGIRGSALYVRVQRRAFVCHQWVVITCRSPLSPFATRKNDVAVASLPEALAVTVEENLSRTSRGNGTTKLPLPSRGHRVSNLAEDGGLDLCEGRWRNAVSKKRAPRARYTRGAKRALVWGARIERAQH